MSQRKTQRNQGDSLIGPGNGNLAKLFIRLINSEKNIEEASEISNLDAEEIAEIVSSPISNQFFIRKTDENDLLISCRYDWFIDYMVDSLSLRKDEAVILEKIIAKKLPLHLEKYWKEDGLITRDLTSRSAEEWIQNEISFVAGFSLWFREKETKGEVDLSELISDATGEEVKASGKIEFDRERLELLHSVPMKTIKSLMHMSPAGKIAYRSMDMAVIQGLSEGDKNYASSMRERTQGKSWWKFWK
tara:strand:+ start:575 stop:1312 length:738 start_codon:yes stop_codon:yes gene_type:complete